MVLWYSNEHFVCPKKYNRIKIMFPKIFQIFLQGSTENVYSFFCLQSENIYEFSWLLFTEHALIPPKNIEILIVLFSILKFNEESRSSCYGKRHAIRVLIGCPIIISLQQESATRSHTDESISSPRIKVTNSSSTLRKTTLYNSLSLLRYLLKLVTTTNSIIICCFTHLLN